MQPVLTPTNTVAHTRSSPQQLINQWVTGQPTILQVDPAQVLQMLQINWLSQASCICISQLHRLDS
jgi:hypothetical protein